MLLLVSSDGVGSMDEVIGATSIHSSRRKSVFAVKLTEAVPNGKERMKLGKDWTEKRIRGRDMDNFPHKNPAIYVTCVLEEGIDRAWS
jgi:hypothetical protein